MDDIIVLAPTRWKLRRVVKTLNRELHALQLVKHPDKTFMGGDRGGRSGTAPELGNLLDADRHPEHEDCRPMCSHINALTAFPDAEWPNSNEESLPKKSPEAARSGSE